MIFWAQQTLILFSLASHITTSPQTEEENAALLAALTDSLDGMVDAEVGGLSVFPALEEEEPVEEEEEEESLPHGTHGVSQVLGAESEDPSLVRCYSPTQSV